MNRLLIIAAATIVIACGNSKKCNDCNSTQMTENTTAPVLASICDSAKLANHQAAHPQRWAAAFDFIDRFDIDTVPDGTYQLLPEGEVFAMVQTNITRPDQECRFETHRKYIDLQYIAQGKEKMGISTPDAVTVVEPYSGDIELYAPDGVENARYADGLPGMYFVFFPDEPHRPSMAVDSVGAPVKKIVVKVAY